MVTIRNRRNAPLVINIPDGATLYIMAREQREITDEEFNAPELKEQIFAGNLIVLRLE